MLWRPVRHPSFARLCSLGVPRSCSYTSLRVDTPVTFCFVQGLAPSPPARTSATAAPQLFSDHDACCFAFVCQPCRQAYSFCFPLSSGDYDAVMVRSGTTVTEKVIGRGRKLKIIGQPWVFKSTLWFEPVLLSSSLHCVGRVRCLSSGTVSAACCRPWCSRIFAGLSRVQALQALSGYLS